MHDGLFRIAVSRGPNDEGSPVGPLREQHIEGIICPLESAYMNSLYKNVGVLPLHGPESRRREALRCVRRDPGETRGQTACTLGQTRERQGAHPRPVGRTQTRESRRIGKRRVGRHRQNALGAIVEDGDRALRICRSFAQRKRPRHISGRTGRIPRVDEK